MLTTGRKLYCRLHEFHKLQSATKLNRPTKLCVVQLACFNNGSRPIRTPITKEAIKHFLAKNNIKHEEGVTCIRCMNPFLKDNTPTLYINISNGYFCSTNSPVKGDWDKFQELIVSGNKDYLSVNQQTENPEINKLWSKTVQFDKMPYPDLHELKSNFDIHHIPIQQLQKHNICTLKGNKTLVIPWFKSNVKNVTGDKNPVGLKIISMQGDECTEKFLPYDDYGHIFGLNAISIKQSKIILTSTEIDAIAVNHFFKNAVAACLPYGFLRLPLETLPYLERFKECIFWVGDDKLSFEAALRFSKKLSPKRCKIICPNQKTRSASFALKYEKDMSMIVKSAIPAEVKNLISFKDVKSIVRNEFHNHEAASGVKWKRFQKITSMLKGHRRGEFTILTGPTGSGKTTFLSEYSLDLAMNGVSTLWGSFEVKNNTLLRTMMRQFSNCKIENNMEKYDEIASQFETLPIHMMSFHGSQNFDMVLDTMKQAAYIYDVGHVILDNLQFMMPIMTTMDRFIIQDKAIAEIRKFATMENIHVTLVIHPRKEDNMFPLQLSSVFGGGKATQEADNVLILQNHLDNERVPRKYLQLVKNRYDGELGKMKLYFNENSLCMSPPHNDSTVKPIIDHDTIQV